MSKRKRVHRFCGNHDCECTFASQDKARYWHQTKNGHLTAGDIPWCIDEKYWFLCEECKHSFQISPRDIARNVWCSMCTNKWKYCGDKNCEYCFNKSFASHEKAVYWHPTLNGDLTPRHISKCATLKCWFLCVDCNHSIEKKIEHIKAGTWCYMCSNHWQHCGENKCKYCFNRSFASHPRVKYWHKTLNNINPLYLPKCKKIKCWFHCDKCKHNLNISIDSLSDPTNWCKYCSHNNWEHCGDKDCEWCFNRSFLSNGSAKFLHKTKNKDIEIYKISMKSHTKLWFVCNDCNHEFQMKVSSVSHKGNWCGNCKHKTEKKIFDWLRQCYPVFDIKRQVNFDWCKNSNTKKYFPFDFYIEDLKLIIEIDGDQHFKQVSNWTSFEKNQEHDIYKMNCVIANDFSIIRIYQDDVWKDKNDWDTKLADAIENYVERRITCIKTNEKIVNEVYEKYEKINEKIKSKN